MTDGFTLDVTSLPNVRRRTTRPYGGIRGVVVSARFHHAATGRNEWRPYLMKVDASKYPGGFLREIRKDGKH